MSETPVWVVMYDEDQFAREYPYPIAVCATPELAQSAARAKTIELLLEAGVPDPNALATASLIELLDETLPHVNIYTEDTATWIDP